MDAQLQKIIELSITAFDKGAYDAALEGLYTVYTMLEGQDKDDCMKAIISRYGNNWKYRKNYEDNAKALERFRNYSEIKDYDTISSQLLWHNDRNIWYIADGNIEHRELIICSNEEHRKVLYVNILPNYLSQESDSYYMLYFDAKIIEIYMQIEAFGDILDGAEFLVIESGLEKYIKENGIITLDTIVGSCDSGMDSFVERLVSDNFSPQIETRGELYPEEIFYVIQLKPINSSIGSLMGWVLMELSYADERGYVPVIDFSRNWNVYLEDNEIGKINPWEYFYEQPTYFGLNAAYNAKNVIQGNPNVCGWYGDGWGGYLRMVDDEKYYKYVCEIFEKYVHISKRVEKKILKIYNSIINTDWRVLGVVYRGTDYRNRKVLRENKQPSIDELMNKTEELLANWNCDHLFLATEDAGAVEIFKSRFGDKVVFVDKYRFPSDTLYTSATTFNRKYDTYYKGEEYLTEMYILAKCNCLLSSRVGALMTVLPMNNGKYENKYIYNLGLYTEEDYK